ncbi:ER membrane protein DP1/Yop1 [Coemansia spiralis]|uniref:Protein YOP1 n=2 Tax=Coemansia TaxID=4863 RepID=A0A9W8GA89_9FUNG|nr:TB2/DP1, HVA22 family-domain-containing protein [Coemansia spiralis]KAJ1993940.1 ER membrane protein DP1/Yop1 [Coemansia umbellata]KAJ2622705.1 ER membrane protein DP1/Yop1 [Coemansia sp. RSA 1358]KAJ2679082.1 ER membrane protein DP1/Yop1 [Coemansia spiralis]
MEQARQYHDRYYESLDRSLSRLPVATMFQEKTGVPKVYGALSVALVWVTLVFFNIGAPLLVNLVGFGYAAYQTVGALESPGKEDDRQWLSYWVVFALFNVLEYFAGFLLYWFPFYYVAKLGFLVWLMAPATRGAERLYLTGVRPIVLNLKSQSKPATPPHVANKTD